MVMVSGYSFFAPGPREAVQGLFAQARRRGIAIAVDPASVGFLHEVGPAQFLQWTAGADWIFANQSEAEALTGAAGHEQQIAALSAQFGNVVIKRGADGAALGGRDGVRVSLPAQRVEVVDSTGAGGRSSRKIWRVRPSAVISRSSKRSAVPYQIVESAIAC